MSLLTKYATPAELAVGCKLAIGWDSRADVARNGGEIFGTPTVKAGTIDLNGSTDYVKYQLQGDEFDSAKLSIVIPFWPEFEADNNVPHTLIDASVTDQDDFLIAKLSTNDLRVDLGNTNVFTVPFSTYGPYWLVGERNTLMVSSTAGGGDSYLYLNKQLIGTSSVTWSVKKPTVLYVGSLDNLDWEFYGRIGEIKIIQDTLTEQDAIAYHDGTMYNYMQRASVVLPFTARTHDPTGFQTLDTSGKGNNAQLGDGAGNNEPTFDNGRYRFDGVDDNLEISNLNMSGNMTFMFVYSPEVTLGTSAYLLDHSGSGGRFILATYSLAYDHSRYFDGATFNDFDDSEAYGADIVLAFVFDADNGTVTLCVNGSQCGTPLSYSSKTIDGDVTLGSVFGKTSAFIKGELPYFVALDETLGKISTMDFYLRATQGLNNV
jgi:hypothetical protein